MHEKLVLRSATQGPLDSESQRVFIIDDRAAARCLLEWLARALVPPVATESFSNARSALKRMEQVIPDLVITDYSMPDMNGIELIKKIRVMPGLADVPIVVVTATCDLKLYHEAMENGATDFHARPIDPKKCCARWSELLAQRRAKKDVPGGMDRQAPSGPE